jgi:hypothetical protein
MIRRSVRSAVAQEMFIIRFKNGLKPVRNVEALVEMLVDLGVPAPHVLETEP